MDLAHDLLKSIDEISAFTGEPVRRLRHLIAAHNFPARKIGGKIQSRKSWIAEYYARPDQERPRAG